VLTKLLHNPDSVKAEDAPVLEYLRQPETRGPESNFRKAGLVPFRGDVSILDQAQTMNWFERNVLDARMKRLLWIGKAPFAHAITVLLASQHRSKFRGDPEFPDAGSTAGQECFLLKKAWDYQKASVRVDSMDVDVDMESIRALEERMFEVSKEAGRAGYYQWGLDEGDHEDKWFPYEHVPADWNHRDGEFDEELEVRHSAICAVYTAAVLNRFPGDAHCWTKI
jgi:hypothetical protein